MDVFSWKTLLLFLWYIIVPFISAVALWALFKRFWYKKVSFLTVISELFLATVAASIAAWVFRHFGWIIIHNQSIINFLSLCLYIWTFYFVLLELVQKMLGHKKDTRKVVNILVLMYIVLNVLLVLIIKTI
jgi:predicted Na+-dependent transporter